MDELQPIEHFGDIAVHARGALIDSNYVPRASAPPVSVGNLNFSSAPWSPWGVDNLLPDVYKDDIEHVGILDASLDAKGRIGTGKGIQPFLLYNVTSDGKEELEWCNDTEILDWLELNNHFDFAIDSTYDKLGYGWNCGSYVLDRGRKKIARIKRHDVHEARLAKKDTGTRLIPDLYLSAEWEKAASTYDPAKQVRIPLLEEGNELADLTDRVANNANGSRLDFAFVKRTLRNGRHYYPQPIYRSNAAWIKIARSVPLDKLAMFKNSITLKYHVKIHPKFWEDKAGVIEWKKYTQDQKKSFQDEYYDKIMDWLTGVDKGYKSLFTGGFTNPVNGEFVGYVDVEVLDDKLQDGKLLPDSGAAINEILYSLMLNPALLGAGNPGGKAYGDTSGGSNVRESLLVQLMIMEAERKANAEIMNVVKRFNGWNTRLEKERDMTPTAGAGETTPQSKKIIPRLVFRYQSGLLTTLDTGKSTKPENL